MESDLLLTPPKKVVETQTDKSFVFNNNYIVNRERARSQRKQKQQKQNLKKGLRHKHVVEKIRNTQIDDDLKIAR